MFYDRVNKLCFERGVKISRMARDLGLGSGAPTRWQKGVLPKTETVQRIADYFEVTTDYLLGGDSSTNTINTGNNSAAALGVGNVVSYSDSSPLSGLDQEIMRVVLSLSNTDKARALAYLYELESAAQEKKKTE